MWNCGIWVKGVGTESCWKNAPLWIERKKIGCQRGKKSFVMVSVSENQFNCCSCLQKLENIEVISCLPPMCACGCREVWIHKLVKCRGFSTVKFLRDLQLLYSNVYSFCWPFTNRSRYAFMYIWERTNVYIIYLCEDMDVLMFLGFRCWARQTGPPVRRPK